MFSTVPRHLEQGIVAEPGLLSAAKDMAAPAFGGEQLMTGQMQDDTSLASFSTTGGSRGSSVVASHSELPERLQGSSVVASHSELPERLQGRNHEEHVGDWECIEDPIIAQSTPASAEEAAATCQRLSQTGTDLQMPQLGCTTPGAQDQCATSPDVSTIDPLMLPPYAWQLPVASASTGLPESQREERSTLEALDDYLASPQVTKCNLPSKEDIRIATGIGMATAVTREELDRWVNQVHSELHIVMDTMATKLAHFRARMTEKDEVIKRLHLRLQSTEWSSGQISGNPLGGTAAGPRTPQRPVRAIDRRTARNSAGGAGRGLDAPGSPTGGATRGLRAASSADGTAASAGPTRAGSPATSNLQAKPLRARDAQHRDSREHARENREHAQIAYLRQEVAQLRRRNNELSTQVRQRETQMDGLTNMIKEMQVAAQRQSGLLKRQLHMRDDTLQAMQEELLASRGGGAATPTAPASGPSGTVACPGVASSSLALSAAGVGAARQNDSDVSVGRSIAPPSVVSVPPVANAGAGISNSRRSVPAGEVAAANAAISKSASGAPQQAPRGMRRPNEVSGLASERGGSAGRSLSAFARQKDRHSVRRAGDRSEEQHQQTRARTEARIVGSMAQTLPLSVGSQPPSGSAASNVFSPRGRAGKVTAMPLGGCSPVVTQTVGIAQAAHNAVVQSATQMVQQQSSSTEAPAEGGPRGGGPRGAGNFRGGGVVNGQSSLLWSPGPSTNGSGQSAMQRASSADARSRGAARGVVVRRTNRR